MTTTETFGIYLHDVTSYMSPESLTFLPGITKVEAAYVVKVGEATHYCSAQAQSRADLVRYIVTTSDDYLDSLSDDAREDYWEAIGNFEMDLLCEDSEHSVLFGWITREELDTTSEFDVEDDDESRGWEDAIEYFHGNY